MKCMQAHACKALGSDRMRRHARAGVQVVWRHNTRSHPGSGGHEVGEKRPHLDAGLGAWRVCKQQHLLLRGEHSCPYEAAAPPCTHHCSACPPPCLLLVRVERLHRDAALEDGSQQGLQRRHVAQGGTARDVKGAQQQQRGLDTVLTSSCASVMPHETKTPAQGAHCLLPVRSSDGSGGRLRGAL
jgi:hypothetical protein